ncbi:hypothetical protein [uncultured Acetobacteroides sp.]|uniref:hypothetical protein n=1 Tax=uncultured Acetobacteroides sp. TaxID=1760811 RepID=UPI0029F4AD5B|nr:hypothetical protein [uncultured Acetobacteroides sp.]
MNIREKIDYVNSLKLDERINYWQDLILLANEYLSLGNIDEQQSLDFIDCFRGLRTSRFIQSDIDMILLDTSLLIARKLKSNRKILKGILDDILYYSDFYPEKYNRDELENEINELDKPY